MPTIGNALENAAAFRKAFAKSKDTNRVSKPKTTTRVQRMSRAALIDKTNQFLNESESEDFEEPRFRKKGLPESDDEVETTGEIEFVAAQQPRMQDHRFDISHKPLRAEAKHGRRREREEEVPETQVVPMEIDAEDEEVEGLPQFPAKADRYGSRENPRSFGNSSRRGAPPATAHSTTRGARRAGSASDTERNDPTTRRKLGDMTRKLESLESKYNQLREVGIKEAEENFDALKKQSEAKNKAAEDLIASLKADLVNQNAMMKEGRALQRQVEAQNKEMAALKAELAQVNAKLTEAHTENKQLSSKLAATRSATVENSNGKVVGHQAVVNGVPRLMGSAEAAQAAQIAQLKEELYTDLTGLIIRSIKKEKEEDIYDCIQTGRNGTLHFKLSIGNEANSTSYDESQCSYSPQLDPSRDRSLMELLPDYLQEEISFTRPHCAKFYVRVVKALNDRMA